MDIDYNKLSSMSQDEAIKYLEDTWGTGNADWAGELKPVYESSTVNETGPRLLGYMSPGAEAAPYGEGISPGGGDFFANGQLYRANIGPDAGPAQYYGPDIIKGQTTQTFDPNYEGGVYGRYEQQYSPTGEYQGVVFKPQERHAGFLSENLETIGPLVVGGAMLAGAGGLSGLMNQFGGGASSGVGADIAASEAASNFAVNNPGTWSTAGGAGGVGATDLGIGSASGALEGGGSWLDAMSTMSPDALGEAALGGAAPGAATDATLGLQIESALSKAGAGLSSLKSVASPVLSAGQKLYKALTGGGSGGTSALGGLGGILGLALLMSQMRKDRKSAPPSAEAGMIKPRSSMIVQNPFTVDESGDKVPPRSHFSPMQYLAEGGGIGGLAAGGRSRPIRGPGDGVSDSIPAKINDEEPAALADGEFVVDARTVSELGNGSTEAGIRKLEAMVARVHKARAHAKRGEDSGAEHHMPA